MKLTAKQARWLAVVAASRTGTSNWAGSPYGTLDALVRKGLVSRKSAHEGHRSQWDTYCITDAGKAVLASGSGVHARVVIRQVSVECPHCDASLANPEGGDNQTYMLFVSPGPAKCSNCHESFTVPDLSTAFRQIRVGGAS